MNLIKLYTMMIRSSKLARLSLATLFGQAYQKNFTEKSRLG